MFNLRAEKRLRFASVVLWTLVKKSLRFSDFYCPGACPGLLPIHIHQEIARRLAHHLAVLKLRV